MVAEIQPAQKRATLVCRARNTLSSSCNQFGMDGKSTGSLKSHLCNLLHRDDMSTKRLKFFLYSQTKLCLEYQDHSIH